MAEAEKVDMEHSVILRTLPSGDLYRIRTERQTLEEIAALPKLPVRAAGALDCPHCGAAFMSGVARDEHVRRDHAIASGQAEVADVELPDGSHVPLELLKQEFMDSRATVEARAARVAKEGKK